LSGGRHGDCQSLACLDGSGDVVKNFC
jgi:hypothetical protein